MRGLLLLSLLMATTSPSTFAQEPGGDEPSDVTTDRARSIRDADERGVLSLDAVAGDQADEDRDHKARRDRKRVWVRRSGPDGTFVVVGDADDGTDAVVAVSSDDTSTIIDPTVHDPTSNHGRSWLGIQVGEVPGSLAVHLGLTERQGVMVLNVVEDSPADAAGLKQYDVVVEVNGEKVQRGAHAFAKSIGSIDDHEAITLKVVQAGKSKELKATLSRPPTGRKRVFKFRPTDELEVDRLRVRGMVAEHGPDGWTFDWTEGKKVPVLGEIPHLDRLFVQKGRRRATLDLGETRVELEMGDNGKTKAVVEKKKDGKVRERTEYGSLEELKKGEPGIYGSVRKFKDVESSRTAIADWVRGGDETRMRSRSVLRRWRPDGEEVDLRSHSDTVDRQFKVDSEGRVSVLIRKGNSQVEINFDNKTAMKEKEPKLYGEFKKLLSE